MIEHDQDRRDAAERCERRDFLSTAYSRPLPSRLPGAVEGLGGAFYAGLPPRLPTAIYGLGSIFFLMPCRTFPMSREPIALIAVSSAGGQTHAAKRLGSGENQKPG
jgi:hypothetical protein